MRKSVFLVTCIMMFVFGSILLPSVNAETFDIGQKLESDMLIYQFQPFTSGAYIEAAGEHERNLSSAIFDGNLSTGINQTVIDNQLNFRLYFLQPLYVNNITIKPKFGNRKSDYDLSFNIFYTTKGPSIVGGDEKFFLINGFISGLGLVIYPNGTNQFYFNDIIINHTPLNSGQVPTNYQPQINQINQELYSIKNNINSLEVNIENITNNLTSEYNDSALKNELQTKIDQLNLEINALEENITQINNNLPLEYNDSALKLLVNDLTQELASTKEDITKIRNNLSSEYDDSGVKSSIFNLESNNVFMSLKIVNLTIKIENLTSELEKISTEVQNLQSKEGVEDSSSEKGDRLYQYSTNIVFGIIIIVLLIVILGLAMMVLKNKGQQGSKPTLENGVYSNVMHEILFDNKQQNANASNTELNIALENKYKSGKMSEQTYNSLKNLIRNLEHSQQMKK
jgi:hypothetical protein